MREVEKWSEHTKRLPPLKVGDRVRIQNQVGSHPTKWDNTGVIIEVRQFDQYVVKVDGSGRVTLRNRKFLRKYVPVQHPSARATIEHDLALRWITPSTRVTLSSAPSPEDQMAPSNDPPQPHPTTPIAMSPPPTSPARAPAVSPVPINPTLSPAVAPLTPDAGRPARVRRPPTWHKDYVMTCVMTDEQQFV